MFFNIKWRGIKAIFLNPLNPSTTIDIHRKIYSFTNLCHLFWHKTWKMEISLTGKTRNKAPLLVSVKFPDPCYHTTPDIFCLKESFRWLLHSIHITYHKDRSIFSFKGLSLFQGLFQGVFCIPRGIPASKHFYFRTFLNRFIWLDEIFFNIKNSLYIHWSFGTVDTSTL
jgi:hypothetical protein